MENYMETSGCRLKFESKSTDGLFWMDYCLDPEAHHTILIGHQ